MPKYSTDGPPHPGTDSSTELDTSTDSEPADTADTRINADSADESSDQLDPADSPQSEEEQTFSTDSFDDVDIPETDDQDLSEQPSEDTQSSRISDGDQFDFSDITIPSADEGVDETDTPAENGDKDQESAFDGDSISTDPSSSGSETSDDVFSDSDASETWGTSTSDAGFEDNVPFESASEQSITAEDTDPSSSEEKSVESDSPKVTVNADTGDVDSPDTDGTDTVVATKSLDQQDTDTIDDSDSLADDEDTDAFEGMFGPKDAPDGNEDTNLDFDDIEIDESVKETTTSSSEPSSSGDGIVDDEPLEAPGDSSSEDQTGVLDQVDNDSVDPAIAKPAGSVTDSDVTAPDLNPKPRIRNPGEVLENTLAEAYETIVWSITAVVAMAAFCVYAISLLMEWTATLLLIFYGFTLGTILLIPSAPLAAPVPGLAGRVYLAWNLSIHILPFIIGVFVVTTFIDHVLNDGRRYQSEIPFSRL